MEKPKWSTWRKAAAAVLAAYVLGLTAFGAWQVTTSNDGIEELAACTTGVLTEITESLDESADLSAQVSAAARENAEAQAAQAAATVAVLTRSLGADETGEDVPDDEARALIEAWLTATTDAQDAADRYVALSEDLAQVRREHPVPARSEIDECR